jgi:hypothetical protein
MKRSGFFVSLSAAPTCQERRLDGMGESRVREIRLPGLTSGDWKRTEAALAIWQASRPVEGTPVEAYLRSRGLNLLAPPVLRFHAGLKHSSGGVWPAMVALITHGAYGTPIAIHRTFLARDGNGKAPADPAKMMLGPCRGGVVRLSPPGDVLMVGEVDLPAVSGEPLSLALLRVRTLLGFCSRGPNAGGRDYKSRRYIWRSHVQLGGVIGSWCAKSAQI